MPLRAASLLSFTLLFISSLPAWATDLTRAVVVMPDGLSARERKAVEMLVDEVQKRTQGRWTVSTSRPKSDEPTVAVGNSGKLPALPDKLTAALGAAPTAAEGFRIRTAGGDVAVIGNDERGVLFGIGYLLRHLH